MFHNIIVDAIHFARIDSNRVS